MSTSDNPSWADIVDQYTDVYNAAPTSHLILELGAIYQRHPAITLHRLRETGDAYIAGRIHSPWGFVLQELRRHDTQRQERPEDTGRDREKAILLVEIHTRNAGLNIPTEAEYLDDVFGTHGRLKPWATDLTLRDRMLNLYRQERARAVAGELEQRDRADKFKSARSKTPTDDIPLP